jgi:hypothetical protein
MRLTAPPDCSPQARDQLAGVGLDLEDVALRARAEVVVGHQRRDADAESLGRGEHGLADALGQDLRIPEPGQRRRREHLDHAEHRAEQPEQRRALGHGLQPEQVALEHRRLLTARVEYGVAHHVPRPVGVLEPGAHHVGEDAGVPAAHVDRHAQVLPGLDGLEHVHDVARHHSAATQRQEALDADHGGNEAEQGEGVDDWTGFCDQLVHAGVSPGVDEESRERARLEPGAM